MIIKRLKNTNKPMKERKFVRISGKDDKKRSKKPFICCGVHEQIQRCYLVGQLLSPSLVPLTLSINLSSLA